MKRECSTIALVLAAALVSCAPRLPPPDLSLDPVALLAQVRAARGRVKSVQGQASVRVNAHGTSVTVPAFVAAVRPDRLHIETLDFFGNPVAVLVVAEGRLSLYDAREKVFYRGDATRENVARLVPFPVTPGELVDVLCGSAPLLSGRPERADPGRGFVTLVLTEGELTQTLRVGSGATVERSEIRGPGAEPPGAHDFVFRDFRALDGVRFPFEASVAESGAKVRLRWKEIEANAAVDPALFLLEPPRGARVVELNGRS